MPLATAPSSAEHAAPPLSGLLRTATRVQHERAESMGFVGALMAGELTTDAYADLAAQHHVIYSALEAGGATVRSTPGGATLVLDELLRVPAIEADLTHLVGPDWRDQVRILPATRRYAARLEEVAEGLVGYAAHAYTRYLGDLSGGLAIKAILQRSYGVPDEAVNFYTFPTISKPKLFKDDYRTRLDALPMSADDREGVAEEARVAFDLNTALFAELGEVHLKD